MRVARAMQKDESDLLHRIMETIRRGELAVLFDDARDLLEDIGQAGAVAALTQIGFGAADDSIVRQLNTRALEYARERAAEMVGKKWVDGHLIDNSNAEWSIPESTREMLRTELADAYEQGLSNDDIADLIAESHAFSDERAEMIARTETAFADVNGNLEAYKASGQVAGKEWLTAEGCCDECQALNHEVVGLNESFPGGSDPPLHPNCFSGDAVVAASGVSAYFKRWFEGEVIVVSVAGVADLTVTPNHPILTPRGWVAAGLLQLGDDLLHCADPAAALVLVDPHHDHVESRFDEVASAAFVTGSVSSRTVPVAAEDFHGDGIIDTKVDVVRSAGALADNLTKAKDGGANCSLCGREIEQSKSGLSTNRSGGEVFRGSRRAADSGMSSGGNSGSLFGAGLRHAQSHGLRATANREPHALPDISQGAAVAADLGSDGDAGGTGHVLAVQAYDLAVGDAALVGVCLPDGSAREARFGEQSSDDFERYTDLVGNGLGRLAPQVTAVKVEKLLTREFKGFVHNVETSLGWYFANGIISHNCRCDVLPVLIELDTTDAA